MAATPPSRPRSPTRSKKQRLDSLLVERGLAESRSQAQAFILAGRVLVDDQPALKAGGLVAPEIAIRLKGSRANYVSRGGEKLSGALDAFGVDPAGLYVLDLGASTGGFIDCLLQRGARRAVAVDVGRGQFAWRLRQDPRVDLRERTNARSLELSDFDEPFDLATVDLSFISVRLILPALAPLLTPSGEAVVLVKPQFEVGKGQVGKGGVVRDPRQHEAVLRAVVEASQAARFTLRAIARSTLLGPKGNREFFLHLSRRQASAEKSERVLTEFLTQYRTQDQGQDRDQSSSPDSP